jgi:4-hydroxybenzoate polyprenyltransferase
VKDYIRLLRPKHILKNVLVVLPLVFSGRLLEPAALTLGVLAFLAFSALASLVYIVNDIRDAERDRQHPVKKDRPIASGAVPVSHALGAAAALAAVVVALGAAGRFPLRAWLCLAAYFLVNLGYSLGLKNVPILDVALLVSGFLLRVLFGAAVTDIAISGWLYLTVTSASFYLGLGKRRGELRLSGEGTRQVLRYYSRDFLDKNMQLCLALTVVFYSLWTVDHPSPYLMWTVPLVICICLRYSLTVEGGSDGDPVEVLFRDKPLLALCAAFAAITLGLLYL